MHFIRILYNLKGSSYLRTYIFNILYQGTSIHPASSYSRNKNIKMSEALDKDEKCLFCNIENTTEMVYKDEEYLAFKDIRPATAHHYLVIPRRHIKDTGSLTASDLPLVQKLMEIGRTLLAENSADVSNASFGFHVPPFNSIKHLHLHVIYPINEMGFISRLIFRPDSYWFIKASSLIEKLEKK